MTADLTPSYAGDDPGLIQPDAADASSPLDTAAAAAAAAATSTASNGKPIWSLDQIVTNFEREHAKWPGTATVAYSFETALPSAAPAGVTFAPLTDV